MLPPQLLRDAERFVGILKGDPDLLHTPELRFLKEYLESEESELGNDLHFLFTSCSYEEFDTSGVIEEEPDEPQPMGDDTAEVTEEMIEKAEEKRSEAQAKFSDGDFESAVTLFTESILANPRIAVSFAKRAANPHLLFVIAISGAVLPISEALGHWEEAYMDLQTSLKLDYSDDAYDAMKAVEPNVGSVISPLRLQDAFSKILSDPELIAAMQDPELQAAFAQGLTNPAAFNAAASNPKFADLMKKVGKKMGVPEDAQAAPASGGPQMKPTGDGMCH
ncbi:unnamed protein product [Hydatigera taeniaeformis]|uniref:TPR_REGION domain-containing protein n=1 Tax=Hydatigena taeniaeformis TaxID=6205 RepID=A0A0R3XAZ8_HYDTA|nr:unnamed protein product [Hydatigera taeniaeformis]